MKRILKAASAVLLALGLLAGCASRAPNRGTINGSVYASSDAKLVFVAPFGWKYLSEEQVAAVREHFMDNIGSASFYVSDKKLENNFIFDMVAVDTKTGTTVTIFYQNLSLIPDGTDFTEDRLLNSIREEAAKTALSYKFSHYTNETVGLNTYRMMAVTNETGISLYIHLRRTGDYMLYIIVTIADGSDLDDVMANFSWIDEQTE